MALVEIATQSWGVVQDRQGNARSGLPFTITTPGGGAVTRYTDVLGGTVETSTLTNANGEIPGFVEAGSYLVTVGTVMHRVEALFGVSSGEGALIPADATQAALQAALDALSPGQELDLAGRTYTLTSPVTATVGRTIISNGKLLGGTNRTLIVDADDVTCREVRFERSANAATELDSSAEMSNVVVQGVRFRSLNCDYAHAAIACLFLVPGQADDALIDGGYWTNASRRQDSALVYGAASGTTPNTGIRVLNIRGAAVCSLGVAIYNAIRCRIEGCYVAGMLAPPDVALTGWVAEGHPNVYKTPDRTDAVTNVLSSDGTPVNYNWTGTPATLADNEFNYGVESGTRYVYVRMNASSPNSHTMLSGNSGGYGLMIYTTDPAGGQYDNLIAHNHVEDTDGFGIYLQMGDGCVNNATRGNTLRLVCGRGVRNGLLPFSALGISGGRDTVVTGDRIYTSGATGLRATNSAEGRADHVVVNGAVEGFWVQTHKWALIACTARGCTAQGCVVYWAAGLVDGVSITRFLAEGNAGRGIEVLGGGASDISVEMSTARGNTADGIWVQDVTDSKVVGNDAYTNGSGPGQWQVALTGTIARCVVSMNSVWDADYGMRVDAGNSIYMGPNSIDTAIGVPSQFPTAGANQLIYAGVDTRLPRIFAGPGAPGGVVFGSPGDLYMRSDGGAATTLYVKETGTNTTAGWVAK